MNQSKDDASLVLLDFPADGVARITLNRPAARNALNSALRRELKNTFHVLKKKDSVKAVVLRGNQTCFAAGADLKEVAQLGPLAVSRLSVLEFWKVIASFNKPLIAAVAGSALGGGCELAQHADIIIAGRNARFGQPEVNVGIMPGGGATQRLVRALGYWRAMHLILTGESIGADEAVAVGLASKVVDDDKLDEHVIELARHIASRPPIALRYIKEVTQAGADVALATGLQLERRAFEQLFDTADQKEGMRAFIERRKPNFIGR